MGFFQVNLGALSKIEPELVRRLGNCRKNLKVELKEDGGLMVSPEAGRPVFFPGFQAPRSVPRLSAYGHLRDSDVVIVYGFGIGVHIRELIQATSPKTFILVLDPSPELFLHALDLNDLRDIFSVDRISLAIGEDPHQATRVRLESYFGVFTLKNIKVFQCLPAVQLSPDYFAGVNACIREITLLAERNRSTLSHFSRIWHSHILENLPEILRMPGILRLKNRFAGRPAIIISAGPSLDKNVKWLGLVKGRAILVCVDTALKTLLRGGVIPDFLVCLDALQVNYMHVAGEKTDDICLVVNPVTFPRILKKHKGRAFMMTFNDPLMGWLEKSIGEKGNALTGGSVATAAFDFARQAGASPIFLVGQDLAYTGGRAYTRGSYFAERWMEMCDDVRDLGDFHRGKISQEPTVRERDFQDKTTMTTSRMISWKRWFESVLARDDVRCLHATEGGLLIRGTEIRTLREALFSHCRRKFDVARILDQADDRPEPESGRDLLHRIKRLNRKVESIERDCREGMILASTLITLTRKQGTDRRRLQQGLARLGGIASHILSEEEFLELNKWTIDVLIEKMQDYKARSTEGPIRASLGSYQIMLGGIENTCKMLGHKLDASIGFLKHREEGFGS